MKKPWREIAVAGLVIALLAYAAPWIGLGANENFVLYKFAGIARRHVVMLGVLLAAVGLLVPWYMRNRAAVAKSTQATSAYAARGLKVVLFYAIAIAFSVALLVGGVKLVDIYISKTFPDPWYDSATDKRTIRTYNLYPYDGFHLQANYHHVGPMPWGEFYDTFDYRSGPHGFFVDFDIDNPPAKKPGEYRIILIGGSGAQGWGAQDNEHMLYRVLEKRLNQELAGSGITVRLINLAMGGSVTYQNFIALNRWGHRLEPDMILSYSGANDITVPEAARSNVYNTNFFDLRGMMATSFFSESPPYVKRLAEWFPGIVKKTPVGAVLRFLALDSLTRQQTDEYNDDFKLGRLPTMYDGKQKSSVILDKISIPEFEHAMRSIRRDFPKIPIVYARQVIDWRRVAKTLDMSADYDRFWEHSVKALTGYGDGAWLFVDLETYFIEKGYFGPNYREGFVHLDNEKVVYATDKLAPDMLPLIRASAK